MPELSRKLSLKVTLTTLVQRTRQTTN